MSPAKAEELRLVLLPAVALLTACAARAADGDWPMYRADAGRTAAVAHTLPDKLVLQWTRRLPPQEPAWRDEEGMKFDRSHEPIAAGGLLFVASTVNDSLTAYDLETGAEKWRFYAEAPIRFAPAAWKELVFAGSDDGCLYALQAADGQLRWKFRAGPDGRRLIGNERLISAWPIRGGPAVLDDTVYFAAGVWPFMGAYIYALDAQTGRVAWVNTSTSFTFRRMPHPGSVAFAGLSPQGYVAAAGKWLIVPGSRSTPAVLDRATGEFLYYGKGEGMRAAAWGRFLFCAGQVTALDKGLNVRFQNVRSLGPQVLAPDAWHTSGGSLDPATLSLKEVKEQEGESGFEVTRLSGEINAVSSKAFGQPWLRAGTRLVASGRDGLQILDASDKAAAPKPLGEVQASGRITSAIAASGSLIVVSAEGTLSCFGASEGEAQVYELPVPAAPAPNAWAEEAGRVLAAAGQPGGYALVWGLKDGGLVEELARRSGLYVIAVERDERKVNALRRRLDAANLYGRRAVVLGGEPLDFSFAPYLASVILSEDPEAAGIAKGAEFVERAAGALRPYGGVACLKLPKAAQAEWVAWGAAGVSPASPAPAGEDARGSAAHPGYEVRKEGGYTLLIRLGPLPGSADWCGQNADAGNTRCSRDTLVKAPLGVLWFGNALSNNYILPRHGEGPVEQVTGGRLFIEGPDTLSAADVYTGRRLWVREFPGLGKLFDTGKHQLGAHATGGNFYAVRDAVYVAAGDVCHQLDPATGQTRRELKLPLWRDEKEHSAWHFLLVYQDLLIAGSHPTRVAPIRDFRGSSPTSSRRLVVFERASGRVLWTRDAEHAFRHYGITAGGGKVFVIDRPAPEFRPPPLSAPLKDGEPPAKKAATGPPKADAAAKSQEEREPTRPAEASAPQEPAKLLALDARTGQVVWHTDRQVGSKLTYSEEHDILLAFAAMQGKDGKVLWDEPLTIGRMWAGKWGLMLGRDTIYAQDKTAYALLTGERKMVAKLGGEAKSWWFSRAHGCGPIAGNVNMLTFRSACAGFADLISDDGTANLGGFRSGCTSNLIVADGVLNAPDYTRGCSCGYQNRSSLALIHMPEMEYWTFSGQHRLGRVGYNLGAPGDRRAPDATLWRGCPNQVDQAHRDGVFYWGRPNNVSPNPNYVGLPLLTFEPGAARTFYQYSTRMQEGQGWKWVGASGVRGLRRALVPFDGIDPSKPLVLRLSFSEPECEQAGKRVFNVALDGKEIVSDLDIFTEAGGTWRTVVKEFRDVKHSDRKAGELPAFELTFTPKVGEPLLCGVELLEADKAEPAE